MLAPDQQAAFDTQLLTIVELVRAKTFSSYRELAQHFGRSQPWTDYVRRLIIVRNLMTKEEWLSCFVNLGKPSYRRMNCPHCHQPIDLLKKKDINDHAR